MLLLWYVNKTQNFPKPGSFNHSSSHMQQFLKMNKHELAKTKRKEKKYIIFFKIAIYKNRAYKNCTALVSKNILLQNF